jgi:hypothetical protein
VRLLALASVLVLALVLVQVSVRMLALVSVLVLAWVSFQVSVKAYVMVLRNNPNPVHSIVKGYALVDGRWLGNSDSNRRVHQSQHPNP